MKKNHSILWKIIVLLFESIIGWSILAGIILLLFDFIFDFISNTIGSNILGWLGFAIFPLSLLLFTYIGISHISRVSNINSSDVKILPIVLGVITIIAYQMNIILPAAMANMEQIIFSIISGTLIASTAYFLLKNKLSHSYNTPTMDRSGSSVRKTNFKWIILPIGLIIYLIICTTSFIYLANSSNRSQCYFLGDIYSCQQVNDSIRGAEAKGWSGPPLAEEASFTTKVYTFIFAPFLVINDFGFELSDIKKFYNKLLLY